MWNDVSNDRRNGEQGIFFNKLGGKSKQFTDLTLIFLFRELSFLNKNKIQIVYENLVVHKMNTSG